MSTKRELLDQVIHDRAILNLAQTVVLNATNELEVCRTKCGISTQALHEAMGRGFGPIITVVDDAAYICTYTSGGPDIKKIDMPLHELGQIFRPI
jgi:hypothetical protein